MHTPSKFSHWVIIPVIFSFLFVSCDETQPEPDNYYILGHKKVKLTGAIIASTEELEDAQGISIYRNQFIFYGRGINRVVRQGLLPDLHGHGDKISFSVITSRSSWPEAGIYTRIDDEDSPEKFRFLNAGISFAPVDGQIPTGKLVDGQVSVLFAGQSCFVDFIGLLEGDLNHDGISEATPITFHFEARGFQGNW